MNFQTYKPHIHLAPLVKYYWTLEVPFDPQNQKQKILPDGCIEMTFNLGDKIKRFVSETDYIIHPNSMVMGQRTKSYDILPVGNVDTIAICFYPYGFANFVHVPLKNLVDKETPVADLFGQAETNQLEQNLIRAENTEKRVEILEKFLFQKLNEENTISSIVKSTVEMLLVSKGCTSISDMLKVDSSKRRQLERHFKKQIGISPKQLAKAIRLQANLQKLLNQQTETLTNIAYENEYFDQAHFTKDFKEFTGITPKDFLKNDNMKLSAVFTKNY